jgi:HEAT repeat protein
MRTVQKGAFMSCRGLLAFLGFVLFLGLSAGTAYAQDEAAKVRVLLRDLKSPDFETAFQAAESLGGYPGYRTQIVPALMAAMKTPDWSRCSGDMRDAIARSLGALNAREAVVPLLELVKSGRSVEHECVE